MVGTLSPRVHSCEMRWSVRNAASDWLRGRLLPISRWHLRSKLRSVSIYLSISYNVPNWIKKCSNAGQQVGLQPVLHLQEHYPWVCCRRRVRGDYSWWKKAQVSREIESSSQLCFLVSRVIVFVVRTTVTVTPDGKVVQHQKKIKDSDKESIITRYMEDDDTLVVLMECGPIKAKRTYKREK